MHIIISPAKKMNRNTDIFDWKDLPGFLDRTEELMAYIRSLSWVNHVRM